MRFIVSSDLHFGITPLWKISEGLQEQLQLAEEPPDAILLAGDLADDRVPFGFDKQATLLEELSSVTAIPIAFVLGNHDLWCGHGKQRLAAWREFRRNVLPFGNPGPHHLEAANLVLGTTAVVGTLAWYDYSAREPSLSFGPTWYRINKKDIVADADFMHGWPRDEDFSTKLRIGFLGRLCLAQNDSGIEKIVVVTHVPVFEEQMERKPRDMQWSVGNAYFGNLTLGERIKKFSKVTLVVSGHTHRAKDAQVEGIRATVVGSEYGEPKWLTLEA